MLLRDGRVEAIGPAASLLPQLPQELPLNDCRGALIVPGFVDTHLHLPQTDVIASPGTQLLDWLTRYTFPAESRFADATHARESAEFFIDELLRNGTTTAMVYGSVHPQSVDALFTVGQARRLRIIAGKSWMDRHCPAHLSDTAEGAYAESRALIERWHGVDRLEFALTIRFAPSSSDEQLERAAVLAQEFPELPIQTHVAENRDEVAWVAQLFPWSRSYLDVYDRYGLLRPRAIYAHCLHLDDADRARMAECGAAAAFCPTSNLFLGSGLYDLAKVDAAGCMTSFGTDVGGGTSFSMLRTLAEGYKVLQLQGQTLSVWRAFYFATLGGARALGVEAHIGNFTPGKEADFVILNPNATPLLERRCAITTDWAERLFAIMMLGDERSVAATYVLGEPAYRRPDASPLLAVHGRM